MGHYDNRITLDVFGKETTYQNDFKKLKLPTHKRFECNKAETKLAEPKPIKQREFVYQDNETYQNWRKTVHIPFDLLLKNNDITRSDPYKPFILPSDEEVLEEDPAKAETIKTRPRIYMSPAVSMDDIPDPKMRKMLCKNLYTSEWTKACQETQIRVIKRHIPNTTIETSGNPVQLKIDFMPPLPEKVRPRIKEWQNSQKRACVDPHIAFWQHKDPPVQCGACIDHDEGLVQKETKQEIADLIMRDKLRLPHDMAIPGYAGYRPRLSYGVTLAKADFPVEHPFVSVTQAITKRYEAK